MTPEQVIDLTREAVQLCLVLGAPLLATALVVGIVSGIIQTATNVHEQSLSSVPKLAAVAFMISATAPWLIALLVEFAEHLIAGIPQRL